MLTHHVSPLHYTSLLCLPGLFDLISQSGMRKVWNTGLGLANHSLSDRRWGVIIEQPMRHLLSQIFQQHVNSATRINSSLTYVRILG